MALSVVVASLAAYSALAIADRIRAGKDRRALKSWLITGSVAMGVGVWGMHFTAMLAYSLPVPVRYDLGLTVLSVVPAMLGMVGALSVLHRPSVDWKTMHLGGLSMALGIGSMHYLGMEAMTLAASMWYVPGLFVLSIVVAHVLATSALYVRFLLNQELPWVKIGSAVIMGAAVSGMHYTAMAAVRFYPAPGGAHPSLFMPPFLMAMCIVLIVSFVLGLALLGTVVDRRLQVANESALENQAQYRALLHGMRDGLLILHPNGVIASLNPAAERLFGYDEAEAVGLSIGMLVPALTEALATGPRETHSSLREALLLHADTLGRRRDGGRFPIEVRMSEMSVEREPHFGLTVRDNTDRVEAEAEIRRMATAVEQASESIVITDRRGVIEYVNPSYTRGTGFEKHDVVGRELPVLQSGETAEAIWRELTGGRAWTGTVQTRRRDGGAREEEATVSPVRSDDGEVTGFVLVSRDVTEQRLVEAQLRQARKLEAVGRLATGIAHEIDTPTRHLGDTIRFLQAAFRDLAHVGVSVRDALRSEALPAQLRGPLQRAVAESELDFLLAEVPGVFDHALNGVESVASIVGAMKDFSHPSTEKGDVDLNQAIEATVSVARNEWKYVAEVELSLDPELGSVPCIASEIKQVVLNMILNASHAIEDVVGDGSKGKGTITISTQRLEDWAEIRIADTGRGIPPQVIDRIFDPFFTTKDPGEGTGQGLSIAHNVVSRSHGGFLFVDSVVGRGTEFTIRLPLHERAPSRPAATSTSS